MATLGNLLGTLGRKPPAQPRPATTMGTGAAMARRTPHLATRPRLHRASPRGVCTAQDGIKARITRPRPLGTPLGVATTKLAPTSSTSGSSVVPDGNSLDCVSLRGTPRSQVMFRNFPSANIPARRAEREPFRQPHATLDHARGPPPAQRFCPRAGWCAAPTCSCATSRSCAHHSDRDDRRA